MKNPTEPIKAFPVNKERFNYIKKITPFELTRIVNGIKLYRVKQLDRSSGVEVVFDIYIDPEFDTNFTEIKTIPVELPENPENNITD